MPYDKRELFDLRGSRCECGCGRLAHDAHHGLVHRMKRFPELDCPENILLVNHDEHILRKFDNLQWRRYFWEVQVDRYGHDHMMQWVNALPSKLRHRLDFVNDHRRSNEILAHGRQEIQPVGQATAGLHQPRKQARKVGKPRDPEAGRAMERTSTNL